MLWNERAGLLSLGNHRARVRAPKEGGWQRRRDSSVTIARATADFLGVLGGYWGRHLARAMRGWLEDVSLVAC